MPTRVEPTERDIKKEKKKLLVLPSFYKRTDIQLTILYWVDDLLVLPSIAGWVNPFSRNNN